MSEINTTRVNHALTPKWRLLTAGSQSAAPTASGLNSDSLRLSGPTGGAAAPAQDQYAQFVADTIAMLDSPDVRQRYQAIVNMTKMQPNEAVPLLQRAVQNDNQQVRDLAQRALTVMQQMPGATGGQTTPAPAAQAPAQAPAIPGLPAVPPTTPAATNAPAANTPAVNTPAATNPAAPAAPAPAVNAQAQAFGSPNRDLSDVIYDVTNGADENTKIRAILELQQHAGENRQAVVNTLLNQIDPRQFNTLGSPQRLMTAISVLKQLGATEATPFFQAVANDHAFNNDVRTAAMQAYQAATAGAGTQAQNGAVLQDIMYKLQSGSPDEKIRALMLCQQVAQTNRQAAVNILLNQIDPRQFDRLGSDQQVITAISVLKQIGAPEARPFFQVISRMSAFSRPVRDAAKAAYDAGQNGAPAQVQIQAQPQAQPQPQPQQPGNTNIPGFLRH